MNLKALTVRSVHFIVYSQMDDRIPIDENDILVGRKTEMKRNNICIFVKCKDELF